MVSLSISIDVPSLEDGVRFYCEVFGFRKLPEQYPGGVALKAENAEVWLLEKRPGSKPAPGVEDLRRYQRHWTPVHLDIQVDDFADTLLRAQAAGATVEQSFAGDGTHPAIAFCSDPFGHGFCVIDKQSK
jgi:uncharacterized glyoxalase superfamily protein PhnB